MERRLDSSDQVVFVLQLIIALGPLAVYFLGLGLVNSQAHPCLVRARSDFVLLAVAFVPVIIAPVLLLVQHGHPLIALLVVAAVAGIFAAPAAARSGIWVVYNISLLAVPPRARAVLPSARLVASRDRRLHATLHPSGSPSIRVRCRGCAT